MYLSIDFGTSSVKLSLLGEDGAVMQWAKAEYPYIILPGEKVEMSPDALWKGLFEASNKLDSQLRAKVSIVCYDTFSPSPVFLDKQGDLVYPNIITHMDRRSRAQTDYISRVIGKEAYMDISGIQPFPGGCSAMTFIWFRQNEPHILDKAYRVGHLPTYIHKKLTGQWMVDLVNASMTGLYATTDQSGWSEELIKLFGLRRDLFGEIYEPGVQLGTLLPKMAEKMGIPSGIPVAAGTNDVAAAQMGAGNNRPGQIMDTAGSSEMVSILTDSPVVNSHYYLRNSAIRGIWQIYSTTCGGFGVDWFRNQFCREMSREEFYSWVDEVTIKYLDDDSVTFEPFLTGDRQSLEKKTAAWHGITLSTDRGQMFVAMLRGMQSVLRTTIHEAEVVLPLEKAIKISGGLVNEPYLKLKSREIPGYTYKVVDDCPIKGNVALAKRFL